MNGIQKAATLVLLAAGLIWADGNPSPAAYEITSYTPKDGLVGVKTGTVRTNRPFSSFSPEEQQNINAWLADYSFKASGLRVKISKKKTKNDVEEKTTHGPLVSTRRGQAETIDFEIILENRSAVPLSGIQLESRVFFEKKDGNNERKLYSTKTASINLAPGEVYTLSLDPLVLRNESIQTPEVPTTGGYYEGKPTVYNRDALEGVRVRLTRTDRNGEVVERLVEDGNPPEDKKCEQYGCAK
jgi:hypothetical protein